MSMDETNKLVDDEFMQTYRSIEIPLNQEQVISGPLIAYSRDTEGGAP